VYVVAGSRSEPGSIPDRDRAVRDARGGDVRLWLDFGNITGGQGGCVKESLGTDKAKVYPMRGHGRFGTAGKGWSDVVGPIVYCLVSGRQQGRCWQALGQSSGASRSSRHG
jgi:hypothetical protein